MINEDYNKIFEDEFRKMTVGIEDHNFRHYNHSMGCYIYSKEHYKYEMKKRNMVPYDMAERMAEQWDKNHPRKPTDRLSPKAMDIIRSLKLTADKHGNICMGTRTIKALREIGAIRDQNPYTPQNVKLNGGFH